MKSTAVAHPIQGLIKYHGLKDEELRLPYHDSISVCTSPLLTRTTVEFGYQDDTAIIDGERAGNRGMERILAVVNPLREDAQESSGMKMVSENNFKSNIGLGASSSGFAALTMAAASALGLDLSLEEVSRYARRGAGSASRSVTGGFSRWYAGSDDESSFSRRLDAPDMNMKVLVALVPSFKYTDTAHKEVLTSPFFRARLEYVGDALEEMQEAIARGQLDRIGELAEKDTLLLHGITMTGLDSYILWKPDTLRVIMAVGEMREEGVPCYFSIDTGATVYINTHGEHMATVRERIESLDIQTLSCEVGGGAEVVDEHLF